MMNDDIRFYTFDLELLYIMPPHSGKCGYSSIVALKEFNGNGSFELLFDDNDLKMLIQKNPDNIIITWRDFQGFVTGYSFTKECRIFGMHLNGILRRTVIGPHNEITKTAENIARDAISSVGWLSLGEKQNFSNTVTYQSSDYMKADAYIQSLMALDNAGYSINIDFGNRMFIFNCLKSYHTDFMLSDNNLNASNIEAHYDNKELAFGGWYLKEQANDSEGNETEPIWTYITLNSKLDGIHKIDTVLKSTTATEALNELKGLKSMQKITAETINVVHDVNYKLGDIIRIQKDGITARKIVTGINMWNETSYGEEPVLSEFTNIEEV